ncbi:unnamed protein product [Rhizophagus irregularis]|nr:unnamed protein product [Rhizophagus irregularis]CAB5371765.1 unnamed protein product [Rhizophagus irregularis]
MNVKHDDLNTEHQLEDVIPKSSTKNFRQSFTKLNAKATPYTPKEKGHSTITFAEMAFGKLDVGSNRDISLTPPSNKLKNNATKHTASDSKAQLAKKKQQHVPPKEIPSVMTGYNPVLKDNVCKITLYNIPSTWA